MFKLQDENTGVRWPVVVSIPKDGGKYQSAKFHVYFRVISRDEARDVFADDGSDRLMTDDEFFLSIITDFADDVCDADGEALEYSPENLKRLLDIPYVYSGICEAYKKCISGHQRKN